MPQPPVFPPSALHPSRDEHEDLPLKVFAGAPPSGGGDEPPGTLPPDLHGHVFFTSPVGWPPDVVPPMKNRPSVINGDGMCFRVDFGGGSASLTSKIVRGPDYYADASTAGGSCWRWPLAKFRNFGLLRGSLRLGTRSFGNTALTPMPDASGGGGPTRLMACYDAGRPFEIDPLTLETISTVGYADEWTPQVFGNRPFPAILTTAHPAYDSHSGETFFANYGMGALSMAQTVPLIDAFSQIPLELQRLCWQFANVIGVDPTEPKFWQRLPLEAGNLVRRIAGIAGIKIPHDFAHVVRWDGSDAPASWQLMDANGLPVKIRESVHQLGVTRHWVILMDTAFKLRIEQFYTNPIPLASVGDRIFRALTASRQLDSVRLIFVPRDGLVQGTQKPGASWNMSTVQAHEVQLPLSATHFLVDYDDGIDGGDVRLHVGHGCALDIGEWVRSWDLLATNGARPPAYLEGMITSAMDLSRFARWNVNPRTEKVLESEICVDDPDTWGVALYAAHDFPTWGAPQGRFDSVYWFCCGLWPDLMTNAIYQLYEDYPNRMATLRQVLDDAKRGTPSVLLRLDTEAVRIVDRYRFEPGWTLSSPQFVPRESAAPGDQTDGYITCTVWGPQMRCELWVFEAADLAGGPKWRLRGDGLEFGFTMHSAWLPKISKIMGGYKVDVRNDIQSKLRWHPRLQRLFEEHVYPHFS